MKALEPKLKVVFTIWVKWSLLRRSFLY